jgi:hypothetical protein
MIATIPIKVFYKRDKEFFHFARIYLSEAFPNPERTGCPSGNSLSSLAADPCPSKADLANHIIRCSPCFNAYVAQLAFIKQRMPETQRVRQKTILRGLSIGFAVLVLVSFCFFLHRVSNSNRIAPAEPTSRPALASTKSSAQPRYVFVAIDLTNASPERGDSPREQPSSYVIPSNSPVDLDLLLPIGSEEHLYSLRLRSNGHVVWSGSARANAKGVQVDIRLEADFRQLGTGQYDLTIVSKDSYLSVPVLLKSISPARTQ